MTKAAPKLVQQVMRGAAQGLPVVPRAAPGGAQDVNGLEQVLDGGRHEASFVIAAFERREAAPKRSGTGSASDTKGNSLLPPAKGCYSFRFARERPGRRGLPAAGPDEP